MAFKINYTCKPRVEEPVTRKVNPYSTGLWSQLRGNAVTYNQGSFTITQMKSVFEDLFYNKNNTNGVQNKL